MTTCMVNSVNPQNPFWFGGMCVCVCVSVIQKPFYLTCPKLLEPRFKCTPYTPCGNITMRAVTLVDKSGHAGLLDCENVANVKFGNGSSPSACA